MNKEILFSMICFFSLCVASNYYAFLDANNGVDQGNFSTTPQNPPTWKTLQYAFFKLNETSINSFEMNFFISFFEGEYIVTLNTILEGFTLELLAAPNATNINMKGVSSFPTFFRCNITIKGIIINGINNFQSPFLNFTSCNQIKLENLTFFNNFLDFGLILVNDCNFLNLTSISFSYNQLTNVNYDLIYVNSTKDTFFDNIIFLNNHGNNHGNNIKSENSKIFFNNCCQQDDSKYYLLNSTISSNGNVIGLFNLFNSTMSYENNSFSLINSKIFLYQNSKISILNSQLNICYSQIKYYSSLIYISNSSIISNFSFFNASNQSSTIIDSSSFFSFNILTLFFFFDSNFTVSNSIFQLKTSNYSLIFFSSLTENPIISFTNLSISNNAGILLFECINNSNFQISISNSRFSNSYSENGGIQIFFFCKKI